MRAGHAANAVTVYVRARRGEAVLQLSGVTAKVLTRSCPTSPPPQTLWMPPTGFVNNCDGGRSHSYCDYRQQ